MTGTTFAPIKYIFVDIIFHFLYFPVWWYSRGVVRIFNLAARELKLEWQRLGLGIMFASIFKPMFGDYSRQGRLISFFMRVVLIFARLVLFLLWILFFAALFLIWISLPLAVISNLLS